MESVIETVNNDSAKRKAEDITSVENTPQETSSKKEKEYEGSINLNELLTEPTWRAALKTELNSNWFKAIERSLNNLYEKGKKIYPPREDIFRALNQCPLDQVKVVILGQDAYIFEGQANGMCFSVNDGVDHPPSLKNILREIKNDCGCIDGCKSHTGDLSYWGKQGVLLLNTILTVEAGTPLSHDKLGWQYLTNKIIEIVSKQNKNVVFLLWGGEAKKLRVKIDNKKRNHLILEATHPSPKSAESGYRPFIGCGHFSKANKFLKLNNLKEIDWKLCKSGK